MDDKELAEMIRELDAKRKQLLKQCDEGRVLLQPREIQARGWKHDLLEIAHDCRFWLNTVGDRVKDSGLASNMTPEQGRQVGWLLSYALEAVAECYRNVNESIHAPTVEEGVPQFVAAEEWVRLCVERAVKLQDYLASCGVSVLAEEG